MIIFFFPPEVWAVWVPAANPGLPHTCESTQGPQLGPQLKSLVVENKSTLKKSTDATGGQSTQLSTEPWFVQIKNQPIGTPYYMK